MNKFFYALSLFSFFFIIPLHSSVVVLPPFNLSLKTSSGDNPLYHWYLAGLYPQDKPAVAEAQFRKYKKKDKCTIEKIEVDRLGRGQGLGSWLFEYGTEMLKRAGCKTVTWKAHPFEFQEGPTKHEALMKLIKFYKSLGGKVTSFIGPEDTAYSAYMEIPV